MNKLEQFLDTATRFYLNGDPIISDEQFDRLAQSCNYTKVGVQDRLNTERHYVPMYSLQKFYEDEQKTKPLEGIKDISSSLKLDGAAISLLYVEGNLVRALTRGDGKEGQVITDKIIAHKNLVPHEIPVKGIVQIKGEIAAPSHVPNSRNYSAGSLNLKSVEEFKTRALSFFAYEVYPYQTSTYNQDMEILSSWGFGTVRDDDLSKIYPSDGLVFRVNSNKKFEELGYTSDFPRGAYALKERQPHTETTLREVEWCVAKTGRVTPIAIFDPIVIDNKTISRATLNNPGFIEALGISIGDRIAVRLAGIIIPEVVHKVDA